MSDVYADVKYRDLKEEKNIYIYPFVVNRYTIIVVRLSCTLLREENTVVCNTVPRYGLNFDFRKTK